MSRTYAIWSNWWRFFFSSQVTVGLSQATALEPPWLPKPCITMTWSPLSELPLILSRSSARSNHCTKVESHWRSTKKSDPFMRDWEVLRPRLMGNWTSCSRIAKSPSPDAPFVSRRWPPAPRSPSASTATTSAGAARRGSRRKCVPRAPSQSTAELSAWKAIFEPSSQELSKLSFLPSLIIPIL